MICTSINCENPTEQYICRQCVRDLQAWIDKIPELLPELQVTVAKQDVLRKAGQEGGNGTRKAGSAAPINLDAWQIKCNLMTVTHDASHYAKDQFAAGIATTIQDWVTKANDLIYGQPETWSATCDCGKQVSSTHRSATCEHCGSNNTKASLNAHKARTIAPDLKDTKGLAAWLHTYTGHNITENQIYIWAYRGQIPQAQTSPPLYDPPAVAIAKGLYRPAI